MIHLYTGEGKGKTTCAIGMAIRAAGAGRKVCIVQFLKGSETSELAILEIIPKITVFRNNNDFGFWWKMSDTQKQQVTDMHNENLAKAIKRIENGECNFLVLDELTYIYSMGCADKKLVEKLLNKQEAEIVITGRDADEIFYNKSDYITEMKMCRHPYEKGIQARKGIEF